MHVEKCRRAKLIEIENAPGLQTLKNFFTLIQ